MTDSSAIDERFSDKVKADFGPAVEAAEAAFWEAIVKHFPEVKTGDFGPEETHAWESAAHSAVATWLYWNHPGSPAREDWA